MVASNGREALTTFSKGSFDLVLMDVQMPELDGFQVTAAIREREKTQTTHTPIVAMTAHAMKGDRERCLEAGLDGYLSKPLQVREFLEVIENLVPAHGEVEGQAEGGDQPDPVFDYDGALARVEGDTELLNEVACLFRGESQRMLSEIRGSIRCHDGEALEHAAHALKGAVGNFGAKHAFDAAHKLEMMGDDKDMGKAHETFTELEQEIARLDRALATLGKEMSLRGS